VAVGDFNGDGISDLAVANLDTSNVSVFLSNGDGTFQAARNVPTGNRSLSVAVADFNGDGIPDLAVAMPDRGISVLLGNGDGSFQDASIVASVGSPYALAVGDFNDDGLADLAVAGPSGTRVLLGSGDGSFQSTHSGYVTGTSYSVAVGDFNGDGLPDLAATDYYSNRVVILANDGIWNGPAPRPASHQGRTFATMSSSLPLQQQPEPRWYDPLPPVDLPSNPLPYQPLLDWLRPAFHGGELLARPPAVASSQEAWDAFFMAGLLDLGELDLAPRRPSP
jgi:hypothetical protein